MSDNNNNNRSHGKGYGKGGEKKGPAPEKKYVGAVPELPVIDYTNKRVDATAFEEIKNRIKDYVAIKYPRNSFFFDTGAEFDFPPVILPVEDLNDDNDPLGIARAALRKKGEIRAAQQMTYAENKLAVYGIIWGQCTSAMRLKLEESEEFRFYNESRDPILLWLEIKRIYTTGATVKANATAAKFDAKKRFDDLYQGNDKIGVFYRRFLATLETADSLGVEFPCRAENIEAEEVVILNGNDEEARENMEAEIKERGKQEYLAIAFLKKLDKKRYGQMLNMMENQAILFNASAYPTTLNDAYATAANWKDSGSGRFVDDIAAGGSVVNGVGFATQAKQDQGYKYKGKDKSKERDRSNIKCFTCRKNGHISRDCPLLQRARQLMEEDDKGGVATFTFETLCTKCGDGKIGEREVLLDSQSNVHIFRNRDLLKNLRKSANPLVVTGINGGKLKTDVMGTYEGVGEVYYHPKASANVLSFHAVKSVGSIEYDSISDKFKVIGLKGKQFNFSAKHGLYVHHEDDIRQSYTIKTVEDNKNGFTKAEQERADKAKELLIALGRPSVETLKNSLKNGFILNCPITVKDVANMERIYGPDLGSIKGKTVRSRPEPLRIEEHKEITKELEDATLSADIFFVNKLAFLLTVSKRLNLLMVQYVVDRKVDTLRKAFTGMVNKYKLYSYKIRTVLFDGEGAISSLIPDFNSMGIEINTAGKGAHVPDIERAIRVVKERVRAQSSVLPYKLTSTILVHLVYHSVSTINLFPRAGGADKLRSPKEIVTGLKPDYKFYSKILFGEYAQIYNEEEITNTMKPRTSGAIAMGLADNRQGLQYFLSLDTWRVVTRRSFIKLPMPTEVVRAINEKAILDKYTEDHIIFQNENEENLDEVILEGAEDEENNDNDEKENEIIEINNENIEENNIENEAIEVAEEQLNEDNNVQDNAEENQIVEDEILEDIQLPETVSTVQLPEQPLSRTRQKGTPWKEFSQNKNKLLEEDGITLVNMSIKKAINEHGDKAVKSVEKEISQFINNETFEPVYPTDVVGIAIPLFMFLKLKRDNSLKARGVLNGKMQWLFQDTEICSPTVSTEGIMLTLTIDMAEKRTIVTVDIQSAFFNALIDEEMYLQFDKECTEIICNMYPNRFDKYVSKGGILFGRLLKAWYGVKQAPKLFYEHLRKTLEEDGFICNSYDKCIFNKIVDGNQTTVTIHVDDLKISSCSQEEIEKVLKHLERTYKNITINRGNKLDYLGMELDLSENGICKIYMTKMVNECIMEYNIQNVSKTPANNSIFEINVNGELLNNLEREKLHSMVQKLLYLSKHGRPDVLLPVSFLTTRVLKPTVEDKEKLIRILQYLKGTVNLPLVIGNQNRNNKEFVLNAYVDASFGVHPDFRSHTGMVVSLNGSTVSAKSTKQKMNVRSSTEAELVGIHDCLPNILFIRNLLNGQGYNVGKTLTLYQDNESTIRLSRAGQSLSSRTRHLLIRYFFVKDLIDKKEIDMKHIETEEMDADFLTKSLQGQLFQKFRNRVMNVNGVKSLKEWNSNSAPTSTK